MSTNTTLSLNLTDADLLALEAVAGHNPELISGIVTAMVKQQLGQLKHQGAVITFCNADHLDNVPPVSLQAVANGNILALAFIGAAQNSLEQLAGPGIQPTLFTILGKIDDDYLITPTGVGSRVLSGQTHLYEMFTPQGHRPFFDTKALNDCESAFAAVRGQFGEGHIQMFPVVGQYGYMQFDLSAIPTYRVPSSALYGLPTEVREEFNQHVSPQYQGQSHFGGGYYTGPQGGGNFGARNHGGMFGDRNNHF